MTTLEEFRRIMSPTEEQKAEFISANMDAMIAAYESALSSRGRGRSQSVDKSKTSKVKESIESTTATVRKEELLELLAKQAEALKNTKVPHLDIELPKFSGEKSSQMSVENWTYLIENNQYFVAAEDKLKANLAITGLRGDALTLIRSYVVDGSEFSWKNIKDILEERYGQKDSFRARQSLDNLKIGTNFKEFTVKFEQNCQKLSNMLTENEMIFIFIMKLKSKTQNEVRQRNPRTLKEAVRIALNYEDAMFGSKNEENKTATVNVLRKFNRPFQKQQKQIKCFKCKGFGHKANNCRMHGSSPKEKERKKDEGEKRKCYKCGKPGHLANNCRNKTAKINTATEHSEMVNILTCAEEKLLTLTGTINGHEVECAFDSGATSSVVSLRVVEQYGLKLKSSKTNVQSVFGEIKQVKGITEEVEISVAGRIVHMPLLVLEGQSHDVLLGLNWFRLTKAGLFPATGTLTFQKESITLNGGTDRDPQLDEEEYIMSAITGQEEEVDEDTEWNLSERIEIKAEANLSEEETQRFTKFSKQIYQMVAKNYKELPACSVHEHEIRLISDYPIFQHPYRKAAKEKEALDAECKKLLEAGIIRPSKSPWSAPVIMVPKKNGTLRMVVDYRKLNAVTVQEIWPMPTINDLLERLAGMKVKLNKRWYSCLDLKSGYYQIALKEKCKKFTAFSTPNAHYEFNRLPFGLRNAPAEFSRIMQIVFGNLEFVEVYLDDITIHSDTFEDHMEHLKQVFKKLKEANLKINAEKCTWFANRVKLLGHVVSANGVEMDEDKIKAIVKRLPPKNVKEVQSFLGICNYYRRFIKDYARISAPISKLVRKDIIFNWNEECQVAFEELKKSLTSQPVLRQPDLEKEFLLYTDASNYAIGAVLSQKDEENREYVISYASRLLKGAEVHYGISEKEALGIVWSVKYFRHYLYGKHFKIITDHSALKYIMNIQDANGKLARWAIYLSAFDFVIIYREGANHANADAVSRPVIDDERIEKILSLLNNIEERSAKTLDPYEDEPLMYFLIYKRHQAGISNKQLKRVNREALKYSFNNGKIIVIKENLIIPVLDEREKIIEEAHYKGHYQVDSTINTIKEKYTWRDIRKDVAKFIAQCEVCLRNQKVRHYDQPARAIAVTELFERVGIDLVFGLPETDDGYIGICVMTEYLSKLVFVRPIKSKTAVEIAEKVIEYICQYGPPKILMSDQGNEFNNQIVKQILDAAYIEHRVTSSYRPQTNGTVERTNQTIIESLRKHVEKNQLLWAKWLNFVVMSYNCRVNSVTKYSPFELVYGRKMLRFEDWTTKEDENITDSILVRAEEIAKQYNVVKPDAVKNTQKAKEKQKITQDKNKSVVSELLSVGTRVYISNQGIRNKLDNKYEGPFTITAVTKTGNYVVKNLLGQEMSGNYPRNRLKVVSTTNKPEEEVFEVERIIEHQKRGREHDFLVKWRGYSEPSWIPESHFVNNIPINNYWKSVGRTNKINLALNYSFTTIISLVVFLFFCLLKPIVTEEVNGDFSFCETFGSMREVDLYDNCEFKENWLGNQTIPKGKYSVLTRGLNEIDGHGYECSMEEIQAVYFKNFFGVTTKNVETRILTLTREQCVNMVKTKICREMPMNCDVDGCSVEVKPIEEYSWLATITKTGLKCKFTSRPLVARSRADDLFPSRHCYYLALGCQLKNSVVVWDRTIFKSCPFKFVEEVNLIQYEGDIMLDQNKKRVFQIIRKVKDWADSGSEKCPGDYYETTQGLFIANYPAASTYYGKGNVDQRSIDELIIEEEDGRDLSFLKIVRDMNVRTCRLMSNNLIMQASQRDQEFTSIIDARDNEVILFINSGKIVVPRCVRIHKIELRNTTTCFKDIPIRFKYNNMTINGFLDRGVRNLVKAASISIVCTEVERTYHMDEYSYIISKGNVHYPGPYIKSNLIKLSLMDYNSTRLNFEHYTQIFEGDESLERFINLTKIVEQGNDERYFITKSEMKIESEVAEVVNNVVKAVYEWKTYLRVGTVILIVIIGVVIVYFICKCTGLFYCIKLCGKCCCNCCKNNSSKKEKTIYHSEKLKSNKINVDKNKRSRKLKNNEIEINLQELDNTTIELLQSIMNEEK